MSRKSADFQRVRLESVAARTTFVFLVLAASCSMSLGAEITYRGRAAELSITRVSDRTVRITLAPIAADSGKAAGAPASRMVLDQKSEAIDSLREIDGATLIAAGRLRLEMTAAPLEITIKDDQGKLVQSLRFPAAPAGSMTFRREAAIFGMGEGAKQFDRRGVNYSMRDGWGAWDRPRLGSWVAVPFLIGADGWSMFVQHPQGEFDLAGKRGVFAPWSGNEDTPLVVYVTAWDEPADALVEHASLVGRAPMPPKWALGFMQSHRTLAGPDEVLAVAREFRERQLPCDALIYLGTGYCPAGWNEGHASLEFNRETFDKPQAMIDALHDADFKVVLHVNAPPRKLTGERVVCVDAAEEASAEPSPASADISSYWARHRKTFTLGVDGWWPDDGDELDRESRIARHQVYYEGPLVDRPNVRPWNLQRTGYAGVARYGGWIWSGDIDSRWSTLAAQVPVGLNHSVSLSPFWGTDIGGFYPTRELDGELYVRWFQFGAFCPSFRAHGRTWHLRLPWGWNTGEFGPREHPEDPEESALHNAAVEPICRKYLQLRYQLLTYNYTLCREAHESGMPLLRALWLHYPEDSQAVGRSDEYLWGRDILVAPVTERGAKERRVYLPAGDWYDFWTNKKHEGGREIVRAVDLETLPLFVRAGAILPLDPVRQFTGEETEEPMTVRVYAGADGAARWYEDDGATLAYQDGASAWSELTWDDAKRVLTIRQEGLGGYEPPKRELVVELLPGGERRSVTLEGEAIEVQF